MLYKQVARANRIGTDWWSGYIEEFSTRELIDFLSGEFWWWRPERLIRLAVVKVGLAPRIGHANLPSLV